MSAAGLIERIGIGRGKYYGWRRRYGKPSEHNAPVPRWFWLDDSERGAIVQFRARHPLDGYRRLAYMMIDADVAYASPSTVYRVLKEHGLLSRTAPGPSKKGMGFDQPSGPHEHWHMDLSYVNICGTFYYLCGVLDGYSRYVVHWEIREGMTEQDVEIVLQRARERFPRARPRVITDNGPQFIAGDFKSYIRLCGMTHVTTAPYYPQSNGKYERFNRSVKTECIRPKTPLSLQDARRVVGGFVRHYNQERLHAGIGYVTPEDKLEGRAEAVLAARLEKLDAARRRRKERRDADRTEKDLTAQEPCRRTLTAGETEVGSAEEQPARDSRSGTRREPRAGAAREGSSHALTQALADAPMPLKNLGSPQASHPLNSELDLSISRWTSTRRCGMAPSVRAGAVVLTVSVLVLMIGCGKDNTPEQEEPERSDPGQPAAESQPATLPTLSELRRLLPPCGRPLSTWKEDNTFDREAFDELIARVEAMPEPGPTSFYTVTQEHYDVDAEFLIRFAGKLSVLYNGTRLKADLAARAIKRFKSLPTEEVDRWKEALGQLVGEEDISEPMLAWHLVLIEEFNEGDAYVPEKGRKYLSRLAHISSESVRTWKGALPSFDHSDPVGSNIDFALAIILTDEFFPGERFDKALFNAAFEETR
jgi:transposase InsO family protein